MEKKTIPVIICWILLLLNAFIWFAFAVLVAAGAHLALPESRTIQWVMAGLAFGCACALVVLVILLANESALRIS